MKTRTLSTLYSVAYGRIMWAKDDDYSGMCHLFTTLLNDDLITLREWSRLKASLKENRPSEDKHLDFAIRKDYQWDDVFWYPKGELEVRRQFLKRMINYTKPWYIKLYLLWKGKL